MTKMRADLALVERGLVASRSKAQALILAGNVFSGDRRVDKAGQPVKADTLLAIHGRDHPWVSRGGIKLAHGLAHFGWRGMAGVALDVGSSTGGFTDVLLSAGAAKIYAVDSGTGQLAWKLRNDPRVVVLERTNARYLTGEQIPEQLDIIVCDASFIALTKVLEKPLTFARVGARLVALIKPQFEADRSEVGKGGVVRDSAIHERVCKAAGNWLADAGWHVIGIVQSPIKGPRGNVEFLIGAERMESGAS